MNSLEKYADDKRISLYKSSIRLYKNSFLPRYTNEETKNTNESSLEI